MIETKKVTLDPSQSQRVAFSYTPQEARLYQAIVDSLSGNFQATIVEGAVLWNLAYGLDEDPAAVNICLYPADAVEVTLADIEYSMPDGLLIWGYGLGGWQYYKKGWGAYNTLEKLIPGEGYTVIVPTACVWAIPQV